MDLFWLAVRALAASLLLTPLLARFGRRFRLLDRPGGRHIHTQATPRTGGIAVFLAYGFALAFAGELPNAFAQKTASGAVAMFAVGYFDDLADLPPWAKLLGQTLAATIAFLSGVRMESWGDTTLPAAISLPATVLWLVLAANALNLIDGLDGLCAGVAAIGALTLFAAGLLSGQSGLAVAALPLAAALIGFLRYNAPPARIFLGDGGSLVIGYLLGCFGLLWTVKQAAVFAFALPLCALALPLLDVTLAVLRRSAAGRKIWEGDREHLHHRVLARAGSSRAALAWLLTAAAIGAGGGLLLQVHQLAVWRLPLILLLVATALGTLRLLRSVERKASSFAAGR